MPILKDFFGCTTSGAICSSLIVSSLLIAGSDLVREPQGHPTTAGQCGPFPPIRIANSGKTATTKGTTTKTTNPDTIDTPKMVVKMPAARPIVFSSAAEISSFFLFIFILKLVAISGSSIPEPASPLCFAKNSELLTSKT